MKAFIVELDDKVSDDPEDLRETLTSQEPSWYVDPVRVRRAVPEDLIGDRLVRVRAMVGAARMILASDATPTPTIGNTRAVVDLLDVVAKELIE